jgi:hypothetical protein
MAGNANSGPRREKPFRDALRMELAAAGEDHKALRAVAQMLIVKAQEGDMQAIKELGDRIDGKVPQGLIGGEDDDPAIKVANTVTLDLG